MNKNAHVHVAGDLNLGWGAPLPSKVLTMVVAQFKYEAADVRMTAVKVLAGCKQLPDGLLAALVTRLNDANENV